MHTQGTKLDYHGQRVYAALDVSVKTWFVAIGTERMEEKAFSQEADVDRLVRYLRGHFPGGDYLCCYEAGYNGFWIHDELKKRGIACMVVNPSDVPSQSKELSNKTDKIDSRKLLRGMRTGTLSAIYVPDRSAQEDRSLVRLRHQLVVKQTRSKNQIKGLLRFYGITWPDDEAGNWSARFIRWLEQYRMTTESGTQTLQALVRDLQGLRSNLAAVTNQIRGLAKTERYRDNISYITSLDGIGVLSAMIFMTELVSIDRFRTLDHFSSFMGLVPREHSSGSRTIVSGMTPRRNPMLRSVLIECAWGAIRKDPVLAARFNELCKRMPKNKAIIRIAHNLLSRIRYVLVNRTTYQRMAVPTTVN